MDVDVEGGEMVCYLPLVSESGRIADPRDLIQLDDGCQTSGRHLLIAAIEVSGIAPREAAAELAPREGESREEYKCRLETPECRTAAWQIALLSQQNPLTIVFSSVAEREFFGMVLVEYLRALIA